jgi:uncharacterized protein with FMN-binding domain
VRKAAVALCLTVAAVVLLARFETEPPRTLNPNSALRAAAEVRATARRPAPAATPSLSSSIAPPSADSHTAIGPAFTTPFSYIQVRATVTHGRLTGVETVAIAGDGPHTQALNARAEPILREEALRAGSADVDVVSGATSTSRIWLASLRGAIHKARAAEVRAERAAGARQREGR